ncbi:LytR/AlgR family response regulator transcription factor [Oceanirhabdus seepicola]|uniref:Stage 0 sporulation protein A homolog n=1 Tax=Oceanirhabdus seepicola TaxID=2828781 RepID=A0A9J6NZ89_9CLOT|nr:LytTR family DNA-binding domain-containing protein [Oceanirhabdus seepicola]MCM1988917.1 response regulator transcription factor [Oceanirhabdus seepicola]
MLNIAICDDENIQTNSLKKVVSCYLELKGIEYKINEFSNGEALITAINKNSFDIIFLDIEMGGINGVETAKEIRKTQKHSIIIFVTAYSDFVFQGYEVKALNYILKPYKDEKIIQVLQSALDELISIQDVFYIIETKSGTQKINLSETCYFVSDRRKVCAVTSHGNIEFYEKLNILENQLPSFFIRIHQRYLVNLNYINAVEGKSATVNGENLPVSRTYNQNLVIAFAKTLLK